MKKFIFGIIGFFLLGIMYSQEKQDADTLVRLHAVKVLEDRVREEPYHIDIIRQSSIELTPSRDPGEILRKTPNVSAIRKGGTNLDPVVRGFKYSQVNVQLNGGQKIEGGCPNRMDPAIAHIDAADISMMEVIKGPFALKYGPNFGGVINIKTNPLRSSEMFRVKIKALLGYESNWNGVKQHLNVNGGNKDLFFALSGNYTKYGDYTAGNGDVIRSHFKKYNYSARVGLVPSRGHKASLSLDESFGRNIMFPALPMDERTDDTQLLSFDYSIDKIGNSIEDVTLKLYNSSVRHEMDNKERPFSDTVVAVSIIDANNMGYRFAGNMKLARGRLILGTDHETIRKDGTRTKTKILEPTMPVFEEDLWNEALIRNYGVFAEFSRKFSRTSIVFSLRMDLNQATSNDLLLKKMENVVYKDDDTDSRYTNWSASAGGTYDFTGELSASISLGRGARSPDMVERFIILLPVGYDRYDYLGNPQLKPEVNHEADFMIEYNSNRVGYIGFTGFFSYVNEYITGMYIPPSVAKPQTAGVLGVKQFENIPKAYLWGWELSYHSPVINNWSAGFSIARTCGINPEADEYVFENGNLIEIKKVKNDPLPEIPPLEARLNLDYIFFKGNLVPGVNIRMVARQDRPSAAYNEKETPGFVVAGASLLWKFNEYLTVSGGIENIFDKAYYEHLNRRIIGSIDNLYEPGRLFYINLIFKI